MDSPCLTNHISFEGVGARGDVEAIGEAYCEPKAGLCLFYEYNNTYNTGSKFKFKLD